MLSIKNAVVEQKRDIVTKILGLYLQYMHVENPSVRIHKVMDLLPVADPNSIKPLR